MLPRPYVSSLERALLSLHGDVSLVITRTLSLALTLAIALALSSPALAETSSQRRRSLRGDSGGSVAGDIALG